MPSDNKPENSESPSPSREKAKEISNQAAVAMELPFVLVSAVVVGGLLGYLLDRWLHTKPAILRDRLWGAGLAVGAALAWLNFRWLRRGLDALVVASTAQAGEENPKVPLLSYFSMLFRYGLIALAVYVIFIYLRIPLVSMVVGLCALGAATIAASVYEILHPAD